MITLELNQEKEYLKVGGAWLVFTTLGTWVVTVGKSLAAKFYWARCWSLTHSLQFTYHNTFSAITFLPTLSQSHYPWLLPSICATQRKWTISNWKTWKQKVRKSNLLWWMPNISQPCLRNLATTISWNRLYSWWVGHFGQTDSVTIVHVNSPTEYPQAEKALRAGETPVGCVLVHNDEIIGYGMNDTNRSMNVSDWLTTWEIPEEWGSHLIQGNPTCRIPRHCRGFEVLPKVNAAIYWPLCDCWALRYVRLGSKAIQDSQGLLWVCQWPIWRHWRCLIASFRVSGLNPVLTIHYANEKPAPQLNTHIQSKVDSSKERLSCCFDTSTFKRTHRVSTYYLHCKTRESKLTFKLAPNPRKKNRELKTVVAEREPVCHDLN